MGEKEPLIQNVDLHLVDFWSSVGFLLPRRSIAAGQKHRRFSTILIKRTIG